MNKVTVKNLALGNDDSEVTNYQSYSHDGLTVTIGNGKFWEENEYERVICTNLTINIKDQNNDVTWRNTVQWGPAPEGVHKNDNEPNWGFYFEADGACIEINGINYYSSMIETTVMSNIFRVLDAMGYNEDRYGEDAWEDEFQELYWSIFGLIETRTPAEPDWSREEFDRLKACV